MTPLSQIVDIRERFDEIKEMDNSPSEDPDSLAINGPMLLDGGQATYDIQAVLCDMPAKDVADKLIFRYFNSAENSIGRMVSLNRDGQY